MAHTFYHNTNINYCSTIFIFNTYCLENEIAYKKFKDWGLMMSPVPVTMEGPVYKRETILLGNSIRKQIGPNMDWGMDVSKNTMFVSVRTKKYDKRKFSSHMCSFTQLFF